jgi:hypothetical protein
VNGVSARAVGTNPTAIQAKANNMTVETHPRRIIMEAAKT